MKATQFVAHRGYPSRVTENTLESVKAAVEAGARYVEVDIQLTKDKEAVLFHDRTLLRLAGNEKAVHELSWPALQKLQLVQSLPITHLKELAEYIRTTKDVLFFIEIKRISIEMFGVYLVVDNILKALEHVKEKCVVISYSRDALGYVRHQSLMPVGVVVDNWEERNSQDILNLNAEYLFCNLESLPEDKPVKIENGKLVVFETEDPKAAYNLLQRGVDLVETFSIKEMIQAVTV